MAYPQVVQTQTDKGSDDDPDITMPTGITSGNLLIMFLGIRAQTITTTVSGWTSFSTAGGSLTNQNVWWREAGASEDSSVTVTTNGAGSWSSIVYEISAAEDPDTTPPEAENDFADTDQTVILPPPLTPSWGADDTLWIVNFMHRTANGGITDWPDNYGNQITYGTGISAVSASANREANTATETPTSWTVNGSGSADYSVCTIAIPPVGASGGGGSIIPQIMHHRRQMG